MAMLELFGTASCPYTQEMREWLEWKRSEFVEYDVEQDPAARERLQALTRGATSVPVLVLVNGAGWIGRQRQDWYSCQAISALAGATGTARRPTTT